MLRTAWQDSTHQRPNRTVHLIWLRVKKFSSILDNRSNWGNNWTGVPFSVLNSYIKNPQRGVHKVDFEVCSWIFVKCAHAERLR